MGRNTVEFTFDFLIEAVWDVTTSRYLAGCAATLVIYDWLLLIDDESRTIWRSHWTLPKTLYYFVSTLLILIRFLDCGSSYWQIRTFTLPFIGFAAYGMRRRRSVISIFSCFPVRIIRPTTSFDNIRKPCVFLPF
jgi:hypothetical protein